MSHDVVDRLLNSFSVLESAINGAKLNLASREHVPAAILQRIESYTDLLSKQKQIAHELSDAVDNADWSDVAHKIKLINGLLDLIRQDAREIVRGLRSETEAGDDEPEISIC